MGRLRLVVQIVVTFITNSYLLGFKNGTIYQGRWKKLCVPGLNCYSCPGALGSCPIGAFQSVIGSRNYRFTFYISGLIILFGALCGRFVCGWLCPFGLVQDLLYRIPLPHFIKKRKVLYGDRFLRLLKYIILILFVIVLPLCVVDIVGQGKPWFCQYICPSGTLFAGIPLISSAPFLRDALGFLFTWKLTILIILLIVSIIVFRDRRASCRERVSSPV